MVILTLLIPPLIEKAINCHNMRDTKDRGYTFMGTHDEQKEKLKAS
jgi:hypothetical protein